MFTQFLKIFLHNLCVLIMLVVMYTLWTVLSNKFNHKLFIIANVYIHYVPETLVTKITYLCNNKQPFPTRLMILRDLRQNKELLLSHYFIFVLDSFKIRKTQLVHQDTNRVRQKINAAICKVRLNRQYPGQIQAK